MGLMFYLGPPKKRIFSSPDFERVESWRRERMSRELFVPNGYPLVHGKGHEIWINMLAFLLAQQP